ncbi:hypothetical protein FBU30_000884, partial [Linnemannia zychae]
MPTRPACRKHLRYSCTGEIDSPDFPDTILPAITLPKHTFDDAVLYSRRELHASAGKKQKTLGIIESLGLKPVSIKDELGVEQNALAHSTVISRLSTGQAELGPIIPQKRKRDGVESCSNCSLTPALGLGRLFSYSPYTARLSTRSYVELSDDI